MWGLRGVSRVILANNPLSGVLVMAALCWESRWKALLGAVGVLASTLTAVIMGQDRWTHTHTVFTKTKASVVEKDTITILCVCVCSADVSGGHHGCNGMLVSLLMGEFSSAGDWYWWLLLPVCLGSATR